MKYKELAQFIEKKMRMSHIYQPILLIQLLENEGKCHERKIAKALLSHDESQIEYYTTITNNMVGKVLRNYNIVVRDKTGKEYSLTNFHDLSEEQRKKLIELCKTRLFNFIEKRGEAVFNHRRKSTGYISGTY